MNPNQVKEYRKQIVEARQRIYDRIASSNSGGGSEDASVDRAEIELLLAKIALEEAS